MGYGVIPPMIIQKITEVRKYVKQWSEPDFLNWQLLCKIKIKIVPKPSRQKKKVEQFSKPNHYKVDLFPN